MTHQEQALLDHWNSFIMTLRKATNNLALTLIPTSTNIHGIWVQLYLQDKQLGSATSFEYDSTDWEGTPIRCQDFGSYRIEYYVDGSWFAWGPTGVIANG